MLFREFVRIRLNIVKAFPQDMLHVVAFLLARRVPSIPFQANQQSKYLLGIAQNE